MTKTEILRKNTTEEATKAATLIAGASLTMYHNTNNVITGTNKETHLATLKRIYKTVVKTCDGNIGMKLDNITGIGSTTTMDQNLAVSGSYELLPEIFNYIDYVEEQEKELYEFVVPETKTLAEFKEKFMVGKEVTAKEKINYAEELKFNSANYENVKNATFTTINRVGTKTAQTIKKIDVTVKDLKKHKSVEIARPMYEIITIKELLSEVGSDLHEVLLKMAEENTWLDFAVTNFNGVRNVYSANMLTAKGDLKPVTLKGFEKTPTSKYLEAIEKSAEREVLMNAEKGLFKNINLTEMFYAKDMDRTPTHDDELWNAAVFNFIGSTEDLCISTTEFISRVFTVYYANKNWATSIVADRTDAKIVYKNEWNTPIAGSGTTGVEFKGFVEGVETDKYLLEDIETLFKMNRLMNTNKSCVPFRQMKTRLAGENQVCMVIFNAGHDFINSDLNMGIMSKETTMDLMPKYLAEKSESLANGEFKNFTAKIHTLGLKREGFMDNNLSIKALGENPEAEAIINCYGHLFAIMQEKEPKAEIGAGLHLQNAFLEVLNGKDWSLAKPNLESFETAIKENTLPELKKGMFEITRTDKKGNVTTNVEECYYMLSSVGVHAKKDFLTATGKNMIAKTRTTLQGLNTAVLQLDNSLEENFISVAKQKLISRKELEEVSLALGCKVVYLKEEKVDSFKFFVADNATKTEKMRNRTILMRNNFASFETFNAEEADLVIGSGFAAYNRTKGFRLNTVKNGIPVITKIVETTKAEGKIAFKTVGNNIHTTETVVNLFDQRELVSQKELSIIGDYLREIVKGSFVLDARKTKHEFFKWLQQTKAIEIETGKWFVFATNNKTIVDRLPAEMTMAVLAYSALKSSIVTLDELMNFDEKKTLETLVENNFGKFLSIKSSMLKQINKARKNSVEVDGEHFVFTAETKEELYSAANTINKAHQELRQDVFTKGMKKYLTRELNRAFAVVITHKEAANVAFVNSRAFKKLQKAGLIVEENGLSYTSLKRYPETMISQVTVRIIIKERIADNVIAVSMAMLSFLLGDTDGDTVEILKPLYNNTTSELNKAIAAYKETLSLFYKQIYRVQDSRTEVIEKATKLFKEFGLDTKEIFKGYRTGLLLNEGTDALTGRIVNWDTKMIQVLLNQGWAKKNIKEFKAVLGAYVAQISIAAKNNTADALVVFKNNWQDFADGTTYEDTIDSVITAVNCKYFI